MNIKTATLSKTMQDRKKSFPAGRTIRNLIAYPGIMAVLAPGIMLLKRLIINISRI